MSAFRRREPEVEAVQYLPTEEDGPQFSERPDWLTTALEDGTLKVHPHTRHDSPLPLLHLTTRLAGVLVQHGDWIIRHANGYLGRMEPGVFETTFEPVDTVEAPEDPATPPPSGRRAAGTPTAEVPA